MQEAEKVKVLIRETVRISECPDGQLRYGKGNKDGEC